MSRHITSITLIGIAAFICIVNLIGFFTGVEVMMAPMIAIFHHTPSPYGMAPTASVVLLLLCVAWYLDVWKRTK